jgi:hypothetical protein
VAVHRNFNYQASDAYDHNLIDLMDEGDNYVSSNCYPPLSSSDLQLVCPTITTTIFAEKFDAEFIHTMAELLNSSQQFNYERDKIVDINNENEYLFTKQSHDAAKFSNDEPRGSIFGNSGDDDTKNKIRFKEHDENENEAIRQPGGVPQLHPTDTESDELDNCFLESKIDSYDVERG